MKNILLYENFISNIFKKKELSRIEIKELLINSLIDFIENITSSKLIKETKRPGSYLVSNDSTKILIEQQYDTFDITIFSAPLKIGEFMMDFDKKTMSSNISFFIYNKDLKEYLSLLSVDNYNRFIKNQKSKKFNI